MDLSTILLVPQQLEHFARNVWQTKFLGNV